MQIHIANDFNKRPGLRRESQTPGRSGEKFRDALLTPLFDESTEKGELLTVYLDGTNGFAPSFLEESFGGLARIRGAQVVLDHLDLKAIEQPYLIDDVMSYIQKVKDLENV